MRQLKSADLLRDGAGEGALFVAEQLALEQPSGNRRAVELDEGPVPPGTQVVKGASDQLLSSTRLAADEHCRTSRRNNLDLLQHPAQRGALADDLREVVFGANLLFQVEFLLGQPIFQFGDFPVGLRVFHSDRDLFRDFAKQLDVLRLEHILAASTDIQRAKNALMEQERDRAQLSHSWIKTVFSASRFYSQASQVPLTKERRLPGTDCDGGR